MVLGLTTSHKVVLPSTDATRHQTPWTPITCSLLPEPSSHYTHGWMPCSRALPQRCALQYGDDQDGGGAPPVLGLSNTSAATIPALYTAFHGCDCQRNGRPDVLPQRCISFRAKRFRLGQGGRHTASLSTRRYGWLPGQGRTSLPTAQLRDQRRYGANRPRHRSLPLCVFPEQGGGSSGWVDKTHLQPLPLATPKLKDWAGDWHNGDNNLRIRARGGQLYVKGNAFWPSANPADWPSTHLGEIEASAAPKGATITLRDDICHMDVHWLGDALVVSDNAECGGMNVRFNGVYQRAAKR